MSGYHFRHFALWRLTLATLAISTLVLFFPRVARPQQPLNRTSCSSDGGRVFCDMDTRGGVQLERHYLDSGACIQGKTWGYTDRGVWVDRGCAGEFAVGVQQRGSISRITPGTIMTARSNVLIDSPQPGSVYEGAVAEDVFDGYGRVAIPHGSLIQLRVRENRDGDMVLGLDSVVVDGQPYTLQAKPAMAGQSSSAAAGEQTIVRGPRLYVPQETLLTFEIQR